MTPELIKYIAGLVSDHLADNTSATMFTSVNGGSINQAFRISAGNKNLFCKINSASCNFLCNEQSQPVLIDPAVYFGHRSMDLAMTTLFGGYDKTFYDAYAYWFPLPANYQQQWEVCNLYPLLIHLNLFGESYLSSIASCLRRFD